MKYKVFTYGLPADEELDGLNRFLGSRKILAVNHEFVEKDGAPYLVFVVEYLDTEPSQAPDRPPKVDYREKLSEEDFEIFSRLRDLRREIAEREGIPVYAIFTNSQIAEMVERRIRNTTALQGINGVGKGSDRFNRGGSWNNNDNNCRSANRNRNNPDNRNNNIGFRVVRSPYSNGESGHRAFLLLKGSEYSPTRAGLVGICSKVPPGAKMSEP